MARKSVRLHRNFALQPAAIRMILQRSPYSGINDRLRHQHYIKHISDQMHQPIHEVRLLYEQVLTHLKENACVQEFLPIFVAKKVTARIRERAPTPDG
jgi:hypothetical protein